MNRKGFLTMLAGVVAAPVAGAVPQADNVSAGLVTYAHLDPDFSHWVIDYRRKGEQQWQLLNNRFQGAAYHVGFDVREREFKSWAFDISGNHRPEWGEVPIFSVSTNGNAWITS